MRGLAVKYSILVAVAAILILTIPASGETDFSKVGTAGAQFLKIGLGARYIGLGEASAAVVDDGYSMYWNPAGMSKVDRTEFAFTNVDWISDVSLNYASLTRPMSFGGAIGFSMTVLDIADIEETTVFEREGTGETFDATSYTIGVGYGRYFTDRFAFGFAMKYVSERISEASASGIAFDFGTQFETGFSGLRMGMNIANLGPGLELSGSDLVFRYEPDPDNESVDQENAELVTESYELPLTFRFGLAYDLVNQNNSIWTITAEAKHPNDNSQQYALGSEYIWNDLVALRGGYKFEYAEEGLTLGGGLNLSPTKGTNLAVDYAWSDFGRLQSVHRFSFGIKF